MSEINEERVLCIPRALFDQLGDFQGVTNDMKYLELLKSPALCFIPRQSAENDPDFKQLIPYHVIMRPAGHVLEYVRTKASGEQRLASKRSVGIGGHVNDSDIFLSEKFSTTIYEVGESRELAEELKIASNSITHQIVGFVNDDGDEVGRVHLGIIHRIVIPSPGGVSTEDPAIQLVDFKMPFDVLNPIPDTVPLEVWSQRVLNAEFLTTLITGRGGVEFPFTR